MTVTRRVLKWSINPISNPNPVCGHSDTRQYAKIMRESKNSKIYRRGSQNLQYVKEESVSECVNKLLSKYSVRVCMSKSDLT
jgi:hypothetical protein